MNPRTKTCSSCGRSFEWRKKWERCWNDVRYCGDACRRRGVTALDRAFEEALLERLERLPSSSSLCPSEIARALRPEDWREHMEAVRRAARRLAHRQRAVILQRGRAVDPSTFRGPIRIARTR